MGIKWDIIGEEGLRFFGKMSASISHEIKNALAIINESAGLLHDFCLMAEKGRPIEPERLKGPAEKVLNQIRRTDGIVKNMNRLAHSIDAFAISIDLGEIMGFMGDLSSRFASMRGVTLELKPATRPVMVTTSPFFLENLIWLCLDFAMDAVGEGKAVGLVTEETQNGARIRLTQLDGLQASENRFPTGREEALLDVLGAELMPDLEVGELIITLPKDIGR